MITKERMSNASQRVLEILKMNDNLSQKEIIRKSGLTERTVRYVLNMFYENDLLDVGGMKKDKRVKVYSLRQHGLWG